MKIRTSAFAVGASQYSLRCANHFNSRAHLDRRLDSATPPARLVVLIGSLPTFATVTANATREVK